MPFIAGPRPTSPQTGGILFAKLVAPAPDRFITEQYAPSGHELFDIPEAHSESEIEPNAMRNDLPRKLMATVRTLRHSSSMPSPQMNEPNVTMPVRAEAQFVDKLFGIAA